MYSANSRALDCGHIVLGSGRALHCGICAVLQLCGDPAIICLHNTYHIRQTRFELQCPDGHTFIAGPTSKPGCRSCGLIAEARRRHNSPDLHLDTRILYAHDNLRMRFHCDKLVHDPACDNPLCVDIRKRRVLSAVPHDPKCDRTVPCDQDFYASPVQLRWATTAVLSCAENHPSKSCNKVILTIRLMETAYNARFDDETRSFGFEVTGYNRRVGLAFTHMDDVAAITKFVEPAAKWCADNGVVFICVPSNIMRSGAICTYMAPHMPRSGLVMTGTSQAITYAMKMATKPFASRCEYVGAPIHPPVIPILIPVPRSQRPPPILSRHVNHHVSYYIIQYLSQCLSMRK